MTAELEDSLGLMAALVRESLTGQPFECRGVTLERKTAGGMAHVAYFYLVPDGPPPQAGIPDRGPSDTFTVELGARVEGMSRDRSAFPDELDLDVSVGIGATQKRASRSIWRLAQGQEAAELVARLINGPGERWFAMFASVDRTVQTLESIAPNDKSKTFVPSRLAAMRMRAQRGEMVEAQRDLEEHLAQRSFWNEFQLGSLVKRASTYGLVVPDRYHSIARGV